MRTFDACMRVAWLLVAVAAVVVIQQAVTSHGQSQSEARRRYTLTTAGGGLTVFDGETGVMRRFVSGASAEIDLVNGTTRILELRPAAKDEAEADTESGSKGR